MGIRRFTYFDITDTNDIEISGFPWMKSNKIQNDKLEDIELRRNLIFCRLDIKYMNKLSEDVKRHSWSTSGGVVRFVSDSPVVAVKVEVSSKEDMSHMPRSGSSGVDLYMGTGKNKKFIRAIMPASGQVEYEAIVEGYKPGFHEWTLNMPLYKGVNKFEIGLLSGAKLEKPPRYTIEKPIVFYGSSITQGACASRPGNSYTHIICRWLDANMVNMGFNGSAKGESEVAELISRIEMSAFIMGYDYNAPNVDYLKKTHENFFKLIRTAQPKLPIILVTKPDFDSNPEISARRREVIYNTYKNAVDDRDLNVYFIDGETLFGSSNRDSCTVDGCHPNDLGFMRMAENIYPTVKKALKI
jgi:hypothetical protein